mgnify:FL=1
MNSELLEAARAKYEAEVLKYKANIRVYLYQSVGIGEHPDIVSAVEEQIALLAEAEEKLSVTNKLITEMSDRVTRY